MADLLTARDLAADSGFIDRVRMAAISAAIDVASESRKTANVNRTNLARQVLMSPQRWGELMAQAVAVNGTINAKFASGEAVPDGDIQFVVASLWNAYAGEAIDDGIESAEARGGQ